MKREHADSAAASHTAVQLDVVASVVVLVAGVIGYVVARLRHR